MGDVRNHDGHKVLITGATKGALFYFGVILCRMNIIF
jgi:hypothetical protein